MGSHRASCPPCTRSLPGTTHWMPAPVPTTICPLSPRLRAPGTGTYSKPVLRDHKQTPAQGQVRGGVLHTPWLSMIMQTVSIYAALTVYHILDGHLCTVSLAPRGHAPGRGCWHVDFLTPRRVCSSSPPTPVRATAEDTVPCPAPSTAWPGLLGSLTPASLWLAPHVWRAGCLLPTPEVLVWLSPPFWPQQLWSLPRPAHRVCPGARHAGSLQGRASGLFLYSMWFPLWPLNWLEMVNVLIAGPWCCQICFPCKCAEGVHTTLQPAFPATFTYH